MDFSASSSHVSKGEQISIEQTQKKRGVNKHKIITYCKKTPKQKTVFTAVKTKPSCFLSTRAKDASLPIPSCLVRCKILPEAFPTAMESTEELGLTTAQLRSLFLQNGGANTVSLLCPIIHLHETYRNSVFQLSRQKSVNWPITKNLLRKDKEMHLQITAFA